MKNKALKIHTDGYYEAKLNRKAKAVTGAIFASALGFLLGEEISWHFGIDENVISMTVLIIGLTLAAISLLSLLKTRKERKNNRKMSEELTNYGTPVKTTISRIERKGSLEVYTIVFEGNDPYGEKKTFLSDTLYRNPADYISVGDEATVYVDRENEDIYYIRYPASIPVDAPRFYVY